MLSIFKKLFGKTETKAAVAAPRAVPAPQGTPLPTIEVAHLSLAAIVARFPDELKPLLVGAADSTATVALPLPTILKQLPLGCVKMSLASLHRQAHGLIKPLPPGDKRSIDVPLAEIFRHVRPESYRRRPDQRHYEVPESGFNLFGDAANPYAISPDDHAAEPEAVAEPEPRVLDLTPELPRVLKMDDGLRAHFGNGAGATTPAATSETLGAGLRMPPPRSEPVVAKPAPPPPAPIGKPEGPTLVLPLAPLAANWPEEIRTEIAALDPATTVVLPANDVSTGLSKGRVAFSWNQIRAWIEPENPTPSAVAGGTVLQLPLKIVAPAFLSSTKILAERKSFAMDESIPALFTDGRPPSEVPVAPPVEAVAPPVEAVPPPAEPVAPPVAEPATEAVLEPPPAPPAPPAPAPMPEVATAPETEAEAAPEPLPEPPPAPALAPALEYQKLPENVAEIFGQPQKQTWTPAELVQGTVALPGVAGAIVALQEGLVVAASLPDGVKSEVVAAFLPQIFARLNQYAGEMRLGDVDDLLFTTHGAHCQIYRLGYVYFAVLGQAGESLPWHELRLITDELARQTHK